MIQAATSGEDKQLITPVIHKKKKSPSPKKEQKRISSREYNFPKDINVDHMAWLMETDEILPDF